MRTGTKSVLWGAHCFFLHPWFVALAWWKLYGFPFDPRLWVAFFVHDLGYWGKAQMDDADGERHVEWGASLMANWFGPEWGNFCLFHSRFYAKKHKQPFSQLCVADKLACALEPWWLYLPRVWASGELWEYLRRAHGKDDGKYKGEPNSPAVESALNEGTIRGWHRGMTTYCREWAYEHRDGRHDTWTPEVQS